MRCPECRVRLVPEGEATCEQCASMIIPRDPEARATLAEFAGLSPEERAALDQWCFDEEQKRQKGIVTAEGTPIPPPDVREGIALAREALEKAKKP